MNPFIALYRLEREARGDKAAQIITASRPEYVAACVESALRGRTLVLKGRPRSFERQAMPSIKPCAHCGARIWRTPNLDNKQWIKRECCTRACSNRYRHTRRKSA